MPKINHSYPKDRCIFCFNKTEEDIFLKRTFCRNKNHLYVIGNDILIINDHLNNFYIECFGTFLDFYHIDDSSRKKIVVFELKNNKEFNIPLIKTRQDFLNFVLLA